MDLVYYFTGKISSRIFAFTYRVRKGRWRTWKSGLEEKVEEELYEEGGNFEED